MTLQEIVRLFQEVSSVVAVCVGAGWVLFNTTWARTFRARLQVRVEADDHLVDTLRLVRVRMQIENKGVSKAYFEASHVPRLTVYYMPRLATPLAPSPVEFERDIGFDVFEAHRSIEPGLTITEEALVRLPQQMANACTFRFAVVAHGMRWSCTAALPKPMKV
jgi:hypothetical protein